MPNTLFNIFIYNPWSCLCASKFQAKSRRQRDRDEKNNGGGMF